MKILQIHNYYQQPGGEESVMNTEAVLLQKHGHTVLKYTCSNDAIRSSGLMSNIKTGIDTIWSFKHYKGIKAFLLKERPDICHVHNSFPLISPSIFYGCKSVGVPVVLTVHNYRLMCANGLFLREEKPCEDCLKSNMFNGVKHKCYRNSALATATVAASMELHHYFNTWNTKVDSIIALTPFQKEKLIEKGVEEHKIVVKANTVIKPDNTSSEKSDGLLFIGRLDHVKGADLLIDVAKRFPETIINVVGQGPLLEELTAEKNIFCFGQLSRSEVFEKISNCRAVILPTRFYEGMPMTIIESLACGKPIITTNHGAMPSMISPKQNGWLFEQGNQESLFSAVSAALNEQNNHEQIKINCIEAYQQNYSEEVSYKAIINIYESAINGK